MALWIVIGCIAILAATAFALFRYLPRLKPSAPSQGQPEPMAHVDTLICTCPEWQQARSRFRQGDPRRLCRHLCTALSQDIMHIPQNLMPFAQLIARMHGEERGMPYAAPTFAFVLGDSGYLITTTAESRPWATVYVGGADYAFDVDTGHWAETGRPPFASDIGSLIQSEVRRRSQKQQPSEHSPA